jgi:hypothetical protein
VLRFAPLAVLTALAVLPASAEAAGCQQVNGRIGYYAKDIRATGGAACSPARRTLKRWLDNPKIAQRIAGPPAWSCTHRKHEKSMDYTCDPGRGTVRFVLRFRASR